MTRLNGWSGLVMCVLVASLVVLPTPALAWQAFAKITSSTGGTIDGDATAKGFEKQIVLLGLGNRMDVPVTTTGASSVAVGGLKLGAFQLIKKFDIATPKLVTTMGVAATLSKVEITIFKASTTNTAAPAFKITLTNAIITQMDTAYDVGADPATVEKVELVYTKLQWTDLISGATGSTP